MIESPLLLALLMTGTDKESLVNLMLRGKEMGKLEYDMFAYSDEGSTPSFFFSSIFLGRIKVSLNSFNNSLKGFSLWERSFSNCGRESNPSIIFKMSTILSRGFNCHLFNLWWVLMDKITFRHRFFGREMFNFQISLNSSPKRSHPSSLPL